MSVLLPADRTRLARILGLLSSPHEGEILAAAAAADRLVRGRGLDWADVLSSEPTRPGMTYHPPRPAWEAPRGFEPAHLADLHLCGRRPDLLTTWELSFIASLSMQRRISPRQAETLARIVAKIRRAGPRAG